MKNGKLMEDIEKLTLEELKTLDGSRNPFMAPDPPVDEAMSDPEPSSASEKEFSPADVNMEDVHDLAAA